jgi:hypothetical protein
VWAWRRVSSPRPVAALVKDYKEVGAESADADGEEDVEEY